MPFLDLPNPIAKYAQGCRAARAARRPSHPSGILTTWLILVYTGIYWNILCTSWVLRCYCRTPGPNEIQGNSITFLYTRMYAREIYTGILPKVYLCITLHIQRYTIVQKYMSRYTVIRVTQYMSVYLSMKFSDKVYTRIYWVHACMYFYSWFLYWLRRHILVHTHTSEYIRWATALFLPVPCLPASTLLARLHPAGALEFESRAFVAETIHTWSRTNMFNIMSAATGLESSSLLFGSSRAISSTGSARQLLRARQQRRLGDEFVLECCRQR